MAKQRSDYGALHALRKLASNLKAIPKYLWLKVSKTKPISGGSKLVLVISFPRSGTHALASMINHPNLGLNYYGEFFIFNQWSPMVEYLNKYIPFFSWRYFLNTRRQKKKWMQYRFEKTSLDPIFTLRKMMLFPGTHTIKIFPEHLNMETLEKIIIEFSPHLIFLRRNHLDRYVSLKKASISGKWHEADSSKLEVEIIEDELMKYIQIHTDFYKTLKELAANNGCRSLDLEYRDLLNPNKVTEIQRFIAINENLDLTSLPKQPTTKKMDKAALSQEKYLKRANKKLSDFDFVSLP